MIALKVSLNGENLALAAAEDLVVLDAVVHARGILGEKSGGVDSQKRDGKSSGYALRLEVAGLTSPADKRGEYLHWVRRELKIGDEIEVQIVEALSGDEPYSRKPREPGEGED